MFKNCGPKIKILATVFFILGVVGSLIGGLTIFDYDEGTGLVLILGGSLFSYISSLMLATFGEIAENTAIIAKNTQNLGVAPAAPQQPAKRICPTCGKACEAGTNFCMGCGTPL